MGLMTGQSSDKGEPIQSTTKHQPDQLSPARVKNHRLNHKLSSCSMSMSAPPLSPPFSDDAPNSPDSFSPGPSAARANKPTPLGPSLAINEHPPTRASDQVPFPSAPTPALRQENGLDAFPFPRGPDRCGGPGPGPSRRTARVSSGGEVLAQLARSLSARTEAAAAEADGPVLDIGWLQTKDRDELEALLVAADAVIRDSQSRKVPPSSANPTCEHRADDPLVWICRASNCRRSRKSTLGREHSAAYQTRFAHRPLAAPSQAQVNP